MNATLLLLKVAATIPFIVGLIGFLFYISTIYCQSNSVTQCGEWLQFGEGILWFGGNQPYSFSFLRDISPVTSDLLSIHYPLFALGPHLCGAGGFFYIADAVVSNRRWAWIVLLCTVVLAGLNDTCGAIIYYLRTGDRGFIIPLAATLGGACCLYIFRNSRKAPIQGVRPDRNSSQGKLYALSRQILVAITSAVTVCSLIGYFTFFLPAYLLEPGNESSFFGKPLPSLHQQLSINDPYNDQSNLSSTYIYGFSVMTAQMAWAAGTVGFGISPFVASYYGLLDRDPQIRQRCWIFLWYVGVIALISSALSVPPTTREVVPIHQMMTTVLKFYGLLLSAFSGSIILISKKVEFIDKLEDNKDRAQNKRAKRD